MEEANKGGFKCARDDIQRPFRQEHHGVISRGHKDSKVLHDPLAAVERMEGLVNGHFNKESTGKTNRSPPGA